MACVGGCGS